MAAVAAVAAPAAEAREQAARVAAAVAGAAATCTAVGSGHRETASINGRLCMRGSPQGHQQQLRPALLGTSNTALCPSLAHIGVGAGGGAGGEGGA